MPRKKYPALFFTGLLALGNGWSASGPTPDTPGMTAQNAFASKSDARSADSRPSAYGYPAPPEKVDRVIEIKRGRQFVNVTNGETILFKVYGKVFAWKFNRTLDHRNFDLSEIAPKDIDVRGIKVYCVPDLYERAG